MNSVPYEVTLAASIDTRTHLWQWIRCQVPIRRYKPHRVCNTKSGTSFEMSAVNVSYNNLHSWESSSETLQFARVFIFMAQTDWILTIQSWNGRMNSKDNLSTTILAPLLSFKKNYSAQLWIIMEYFFYAIVHWLPEGSFALLSVSSSGTSCVINVLFITKVLPSQFCSFRFSPSARHGSERSILWHSG